MNAPGSLHCRFLLALSSTLSLLVATTKLNLICLPALPLFLQNLLKTSKIQNALAAKGIVPNDDGSLASNDSNGTDFDGFNLNQGIGGLDDDDDDDDYDYEDDDGSYTDDADLRRKLNRLAGPGGAMEAESREAPHLFAPGGPLESPEMARAVGGPLATGGGGDGGGRCWRVLCWSWWCLHSVTVLMLPLLMLSSSSLVAVVVVVVKLRGLSRTWYDGRFRCRRWSAYLLDVCVCVFFFFIFRKIFRYF